MTEDRPRALSPYDVLPPVPGFSVTSNDIADGQSLGNDQLYNGFGVTGGNVSPHLRWEGQPTGTRSFAVSCFDKAINLYGLGCNHRV